MCHRTYRRLSSFQQLLLSFVFLIHGKSKVFLVSSKHFKIPNKKVGVQITGYTQIPSP